MVREDVALYALTTTPVHGATRFQSTPRTGFAQGGQKMRTARRRRRPSPQIYAPKTRTRPIDARARRQKADGNAPSSCAAVHWPHHRIRTGRHGERVLVSPHRIPRHLSQAVSWPPPPLRIPAPAPERGTALYIPTCGRKTSSPRSRSFVARGALRGAKIRYARCAVYSAARPAAFLGCHRGAGDHGDGVEARSLPLGT